MGYNTFMAGFNDGTISIDIVPDGDGFQLKLDKILNATSGSVELKPDVAKLASNVKKAAKLIPAIEIKATIDPNLTKGSLSGLKTKVEQALGGFSDKVGNSTYKIRPNVELDVRFTETSLKKLKGSVNGAFRNVETSAESGTRKITASANIGVKFTETSLRGLKRDVKNVFKKEQVDLATGKKIKVVAPIDIKAELDFSQNKANKFRTDVRRKISGVTGDGSKGQKYNIKLGSELGVPSAANIRLTKSILLEKFGVVKLPVVTVGRTLAINNAGAGVASAAVNSGTAKSIAINGAAAKSVKGLADANSGLNGTLRSIGQAQQASRGSFTSFIGGVNLARVASIGLVAGLSRVTYSLVKIGLESSKAFETARLSIGNLISGDKSIKDASRVTDLFLERLQSFANVTPFNLENVLTGSQRLLGAQFKVADIIPSLTKIGDVGAVLGVSGDAIERVATALAKIKGQGKVTQRELRTIFTAFPGFNPFDAIAKGTESLKGLSKGGVLKAISKGAVGADQAIEALLDGMAKFPGAANAMAKQALTAAGSLETLKDETQNALRNAIVPALPFLAKDMRDAGDVILEGSKRVQGGLTTLFRNAGDLIAPSAAIVFPFTDSLTEAIGKTIPTIAQILDDFGPVAAKSLGVLIKLLPLATDGLSMALRVVEPFIPVLEIFVNLLDSIPESLISAAIAFKLFNATASKFGLARGKIFGPPDPNEKNGFFARSSRDLKGLRVQSIADFRQIKNVSTNSFKSMGNAFSNFSKKVNAKAYTKYVSDVIHQEERRINKLVTGDKVEQDLLLSRRNRKYKPTFVTGANGVTEDLDFRDPVMTADKKFNIKQDYSQTFGGLNQISRTVDTLDASQVSVFRKMSAGASVAGKAVKDSIVGGFTKATSAARSAGGSFVNALGGPVALAITAATIGLTFLLDKWQKNKQAAKEYAEEARLAGEALSLDAVSKTPQDFALNAINELKKIDKSKKDIEGALAGVTNLEGKGFKNIKAGRKTDQSYLAAGMLGLNGRLVGTTGATDPLQEDTAFAIENGLTSVQLADLANNKKKRDGFLKDLRASNKAESGYSDIFRNTEADKLNTYAKQVEKSTGQILSSSKASFKANQETAKNLGNNRLAEFFKKQQEIIDRTGELPKNIGRVSKAVTELSIAQSRTEDGAFAAALGLTKETEAMQASGGATALASEELSEFNSELAKTLDSFDGFSADQTFKALSDTPKAFASLAGQFDQATSSGQGAEFVESFLLNSGIADTADNRKKITDTFAGFQSMIVDLYQDAVANLKSKLPGISEIFAEEFELKGGVGAGKLAANTKKLTAYVTKFTDDIGYLAKTKFASVANLLAEQGPALSANAASELRKQAEAGNFKTLEAIQVNYDKFKQAIIDGGDKLSLAAKQAIASAYGLDPEIVIKPEFKTEIDQTKIDAIAAELVAVDAKIYAKKKALELVTPYDLGSFKGKLGAAGANYDAGYAGLLAERDRLMGEQKALNADLFNSTKEQAAVSTAAINTEFSKVNISGAIAPSIEQAANDLAAVPQKIRDTFTNDFKANSLLNLTGNEIGKGFVDGIKVGLDAQLLLVSEPIRVQFRTLGQQIAESIAYGFGVGNDAITNAIKKPFNDASTPLNSFFGTLVAASKAVGISASFAPIPQFHTGGIAGEKAVTHNGRFTRDEMLAVVKKKEGILPETSMKKLGKARFEMLRRGEFGDGPGINGEALANYSTDKDRVAINQAKDNYFSRYRKTDISGPLNKRMADKIVESYAFASLKKLDEIQAKVDAANIDGVNVPGVISSGQVYNSLLAAKGKFGSFITLIKAMRGTGMPFGVSSTIRPGAITASGNRSLHGAARAVDFTGTGPQMLKMARWWAQYGPVLAELIHTPMGFGYKNGKKVSSFGSVVDKGHYNHGHVALFRGGLVKGSSGGIVANIGERGQSEAVLPLGQPDRMASIISHAIRSGEMSESGQRAIANVIGQGQTTNHNVTNQEVTVNVVAPVKDAELQGTIIQHRVSAALKGM